MTPGYFKQGCLQFKDGPEEVPTDLAKIILNLICKN